ncbi:hypothetical protein KBC79_06400 [Candidatus Woesebacteria bacterium]|nr:hypothetical protein [Candidatus Woesebacteria bacterium]
MPTPFNLERNLEIAEHFCRQVPTSVAATFCHCLTLQPPSDRPPVVLIEPRFDLGQNQLIADHHYRTDRDLPNRHYGFTSAAIIALHLILLGEMPRRVIADPQTKNPDQDQLLAMRLIRVWAETGQVVAVLQLVSEIPQLLRDEFWLMTRRSLEEILEKSPSPLFDPEFATKPARITRFASPGKPPILHVEISTSKSAFAGDHTRYQAYIRWLTIRTGFTTENALVFVQNYYGRSAKRMRDTDGTLGIIGSYSDLMELQGVGITLDELFRKITHSFAARGFSSIHPSTRNMLTIVQPPKMTEDGGSTRYQALSNTLAAICQELGYVALPATYVGKQEVLIANGSDF